MLCFADLDGTHFNNEHRFEAIPSDKTRTENWHEFNALHIYDRPIEYRIRYLRLLAMSHEVVYLTSRTEAFADTTTAQLNMHGCPKGQVTMRGVDDHRPSAEFKLQAIREALAVHGLGTFILIDDDRFVCEAVAARYPRARIVKVPSQCCAYLAGAQCDA